MKTGKQNLKSDSESDLVLIFKVKLKVFPSDGDNHNWSGKAKLYIIHFFFYQKKHVEIVFI